MILSSSSLPSPLPLQFVLGFVSYLYPQLSQGFRISLGPVHRFLGMATWTLGLCTMAVRLCVCVCLCVCWMQLVDECSCNLSPDLLLSSFLHNPSPSHQTGFQEKVAFIQMGKGLSGAALFGGVVRIPAVIVLLLAFLAVVVLYHQVRDSSYTHSLTHSHAYNTHTHIHTHSLSHTHICTQHSHTPLPLPPSLFASRWSLQVPTPAPELARPLPWSRARGKRASGCSAGGTQMHSSKPVLFLFLYFSSSFCTSLPTFPLSLSLRQYCAGAASKQRLAPSRYHK
jgi:hypothetical protein